MESKTYKENFKKPGLHSLLLTTIVGILPKIGPFAKTKMIDPNQEVDSLFLKSFDKITRQFNKALKDLQHSNKVEFANLDLDTGKKTMEGEYGITDKAYYKFLMKHCRNNFSGMDKDLKTNILKFF
jgi:hypothetical protein